MRKQRKIVRLSQEATKGLIHGIPANKISYSPTEVRLTKQIVYSIVSTLSESDDNS